MSTISRPENPSRVLRCDERLTRKVFVSGQNRKMGFTFVRYSEKQKSRIAPA
jgi:hypothetical protein